MRTNRTRSVMSKRTTTTTAGIIALAIGALVGCSDNPRAGDPAYKEGELGNGDFLFACDDGAACLPYSGDASRFPDQIATGSNFDVRFVAKNQQGSAIVIKDKRYEGIVAQPVGPFVGKGPVGFAALKPGYGTIIVRDSKGTVYPVSYTMVQLDGQWKLRNVIINGINIGKLFRDQFADSMQRNGNNLDKTIDGWAEVVAKAKESAEGQQASGQQ